MSERILFGRYKLVGNLSGAGMSSVFFGEDLQLEKPIVVKMISASNEGNIINVNRFRAEASLLQSLNHPGIVNIYDSGTDNNDLFYVMEYVPGTLLSECERLSISKLFDIFIDITETVAYLHSKGIVHRDIKPSNIIVLPSVDRQGLHSKLIDFGLARFCADGRITSKGSVVGTLHYLAPEILLGNPIDTRSDIYSLGVSIYKTITGEYPINSSNPEVLISMILQNIQNSVLKHSALVPQKLDNLISLMLMKNPSQRIQSIEEVTETLKNIRYSELQTRSNNPTIVNIPELVDRQWEIHTIKDSWSRNIDKRIILLSGPFGIGKTRITDEFASSLHLYRHPVLRARGNSASTPSKGSGLVQLSFDLWRIESGSENFKGNTRESITDLTNLSRETTFIDTSRLAIQFEQILSDNKRKVAIILDDIHMLDWFSVEFCIELAQKHKHIFILMTQINENNIYLKDKYLKDITHLPIEPLEGIDLTTIIGKSLGTQSIPQQLISDVIHNSKGNPLYILEFLRMQVSKGILRKNGKNIEYIKTSIDDEKPLCDIDIINTSLKNLSTSAKIILEFAALFNDFFSFNELLEGFQLSRDQINNDIDELQQRLLITSKNFHGNVLFRFNNSLVRSTIVSRISNAKQTNLYLSIAKLLISRKLLSLVEYNHLAYYLYQAQLHEQSLTVLIYYLCESIIHNLEGRIDIIKEFEQLFSNADYTFSSYIRNVIDSIYIAKNGKPFEAESLLNKFTISDSIYRYLSIHIINIIRINYGSTQSSLKGMNQLLDDLNKLRKPLFELETLIAVELSKQYYYSLDYRSSLKHIEKALHFSENCKGFLHVSCCKLKVSLFLSMLKGDKARTITDHLNKTAMNTGNLKEQLCNRFIYAIIDFMDMNVSKSKDSLTSLLIQTRHLPELCRSTKTHSMKVDYHLGNWNDLIDEDIETRTGEGLSSYAFINTVMQTYYKALVNISRHNLQTSELESKRIHNMSKNSNNAFANIYSGITLGKTHIHAGLYNEGKMHLEKAWQLACEIKDTGLILTGAFHILNTPGFCVTDKIIDDIELTLNRIFCDDLSLRYKILIKHNLGACYDHRKEYNKHDTTRYIELLEDVIERGKEDMVLVAKTAMHLASLYHKRMQLTGKTTDSKLIENNIGVAEFIWRVVEAETELKALYTLKRNICIN